MCSGKILETKNSGQVLYTLQGNFKYKGSSPVFIFELWYFYIRRLGLKHQKLNKNKQAYFTTKILIPLIFYLGGSRGGGGACGFISCK